MCHYDVEIEAKPHEKLIFKGPQKFSVKAKDIFTYDLAFLPTSEQKFEVKLVLKSKIESENVVQMY